MEFQSKHPKDTKCYYRGYLVAYNWLNNTWFVYRDESTPSELMFEDFPSKEELKATIDGLIDNNKKDNNIGA